MRLLFPDLHQALAASNALLFLALRQTGAFQSYSKKHIPLTL